MCLEIERQKNFFMRFLLLKIVRVQIDKKNIRVITIITKRIIEILLSFFSDFALLPLGLAL